MTMTFVLRTMAISSLASLLAACSGSSDGESENTSTADEFLSAPTCAPSLANGAVAAKPRALLDTIAFTEGTRGRGQDGYNVTFGYRYFTSCDKHPNWRICSGSYCSTAAGRYQFLTATWKGLGYANFHPDNQDRGAMKLIARRKASVPTSRALTATEFVNVMYRVSYEWASLPPGRYGQPSYSMTKTRAKYCTFAGCDGKGPSTPGCHSDTLGKDVPNNACVQSKSDKKWYQCNAGHWVDRWSDPNACSSVHPL
jgi:muramidase (phage lysozyme)